MAALLETSELTKQFVRKPDLAARIAGRVTGQARTEVVHLVELSAAEQDQQSSMAAAGAARRRGFTPRPDISLRAGL